MMDGRDGPSDAEIRGVYGDDLDALVEHGYLETWIDPATGEQKYQMTEWGRYETVVGTVVNEWQPLAVDVWRDGDEEALEKLVELCYQSKQITDGLDRGVIRAWLLDKINRRDERLNDCESFIEQHSSANDRGTEGDS